MNYSCLIFIIMLSMYIFHIDEEDMILSKRYYPRDIYAPILKLYRIYLV